MRSSAISAPSPTLLKFLRSQSEGICFFSPNPTNGTFVFNHAAPRACLPKTALKPTRDSSVITPTRSIKAGPTVQPFSMSAMRPNVAQIGLFKGEILMPRATREKRKTGQGNLHTSARVHPPPRFQNPRQGRDIHLRFLNTTERKSAPRSWRSWWHQTWFKRSEKKRQHALRQDDLPLGRGGNYLGSDESPESMIAIGRTVSVKAANEAKLRCTEFDENGNVVLVDGQFKKSELIAKVCFTP
jgi:magnesium transporter